MADKQVWGRYESGKSSYLGRSMLDSEAGARSRWGRRR